MPVDSKSVGPSNEITFSIILLDKILFCNSKAEDIRLSIEDAIKEHDEITLPGLGVFFEIIWFLLFFVSATLYRLSFYKEIQCKEAIIEGDISRIHIDGDVCSLESPLHLKILPGALKVVVPKPKFT